MARLAPTTGCGRCAATLLLLAATGGCTVFDEELRPPDECARNSDCAGTFLNGDTGMAEPAVCVEGPAPDDAAPGALKRRCVQVTSTDCRDTGFLDENGQVPDDAILLGALMPFAGPQRDNTPPRLNSAMLAMEQINAPGVGGIPGLDGADNRPLALVVCDEATDLARATLHLVEELRVPAVVGPVIGQSLFEIQPIIRDNDTAFFSPTVVADAVGAFDDKGLIFQMVLTDVQRAPLMNRQIRELESQLRVSRSRDAEPIRLGTFFRADALGEGTHVGLLDLEINGQPYPQEQTVGHVRATGYSNDDLESRPQFYIDDLLDGGRFLPDIIVIAGAGEVPKNFLAPLEAQWPDEWPRPYYVTIDPMRIGPLLDFVSESDGTYPDLRLRIRGTGVTARSEGDDESDAARAFGGFVLAYRSKVSNNEAPIISGMAPAYDAVFAIAFALAAQSQLPVTGSNLAAGLPLIAGGRTKVVVGQSAPNVAFAELTSRRAISAIGTFGPLEWDRGGQKKAGVLEMWCIDGQGEELVFQPSGLNYVFETGEFLGAYEQCPPVTTMPP